MVSFDDFQRNRSLRSREILLGAVTSILLHSIFLMGSKYWLTAFMREPKPEIFPEIPIEVVEVPPNETDIPPQTSLRALKNSIAGGKALPEKPVSTLKSANPLAENKASSQSPVDSTISSPAEVFQPEREQQKTKSPNLSPQAPQPKPQKTALAPATTPQVFNPKKIAVAPLATPPPTPASTSQVLNPKKIAVAPSVTPPPDQLRKTALAPATTPQVFNPKKIAVAPLATPPPTPASTSQVLNPKKIAVAPSVTPPPDQLRKTALAPASTPQLLNPKKIAVAPLATPPTPASTPQVFNQKKLAVAPLATPPPAPASTPQVLNPKKIAVAPSVTPPPDQLRKTALTPASTPQVLNPKKIAVAPSVTPTPASTPQVLNPKKIAVAPLATAPPTPATASTSQVLNPKKIAVAPSATPPPAQLRKTALAPASTSLVSNPKNLEQSATRFSGRTQSQAQSALKTGAASLLGGTLSVSSQNFRGDYLAALPNSNRNNQAHSGIDASNQDVDITSYLNQVQQQVKQQWLPGLSQSNQRTVLNFTINRFGQLSNLQLVQTSGFSVTDQAALNAIQRAAPFAPLPTGYSSNHINIEFTFNINVYGQLNLLGDGG